MNAKLRRRCKPTAVWAVRAGMVIIDSYKTERGNTRREAFRVDRITDGPRSLVILEGPGVYLADPDRFLTSGKKRRVTLSPGSQVTRVLPPGHPDVAR